MISGLAAVIIPLLDPSKSLRSPSKVASLVQLSTLQIDPWPVSARGTPVTKTFTFSRFSWNSNSGSFSSRRRSTLALSNRLPSSSIVCADRVRKMHPISLLICPARTYGAVPRMWPWLESVRFIRFRIPSTVTPSGRFTSFLVANHIVMCLLLALGVGDEDGGGGAAFWGLVWPRGVLCTVFLGVTTFHAPAVAAAGPAGTAVVCGAAGSLSACSAPLSLVGATPLGLIWTNLGFP